jgi:hypothetical protein
MIFCLKNMERNLEKVNDGFFPQAGVEKGNS